MPRTTSPIIDDTPAEAPQPTRRRNLPEVHIRNTRCHWPCPCGGTVPDVPESCPHRKFVSKPSTYCTDVLSCMHSCPDKLECESLRAYFKMVGDVREYDRREGDAEVEVRAFNMKTAVQPSTRRRVPVEDEPVVTTSSRRRVPE